MPMLAAKLPALNDAPVLLVHVFAGGAFGWHPFCSRLPQPQCRGRSCAPKAPLSRVFCPASGMAWHAARLSPVCGVYASLPSLPSVAEEIGPQGSLCSSEGAAHVIGC